MNPIINLIIPPGLISTNFLKCFIQNDLLCKKLFICCQDSDTFEHIYQQCKFWKTSNYIESFNLFSLSKNKNYHETINNIFITDIKPIPNSFLFFLSPNISLYPSTLPLLLEAFQTTPDLVGVNPLLIAAWRKDGDFVAHMGTVVDCKKQLHYLYEGIHLDNPLVLKRRRFQLAHPGALLIRHDDFVRVGGFQEKFPHLAFYSLCVALTDAGKKSFSTVPEARADSHNPFDSINFCGTWNSILQRGRLNTSALEVNYPSIANSDGVEYSIDKWLNENADLPDEALSSDPEFHWRHHPDPFTLLSYIATLPVEYKARALNAIRSLPSFLPRVFRYYEVALWEIQSWATDADYSQLVKQCEEWGTKKRLFHYSQLKKGIKLLKDAGIYSSSLEESPAIFDAWVEIEESFSRIEPGKAYPEIAVLMPVWNPQPGFLIQAIESVQRQEYSGWQLCIADDASTDPAIRTILESYANDDARIKITYRKENGHICKASNSALELVNAPFTAFFDHDDMLAPQALGEVAKTIADKPDLAYIYSDDDRIDENNVRRSPVFKPDYDGDLFFTDHLSVFSTAIIRSLNGLRPGTEGSQDRDLLLRTLEIIDISNIAHIPEILYHWRVHENSTSASIETKPYALEASKKVLIDAAKRKGFNAQIIANRRNNFFRLLYDIPQGLSCTIIFYSNQGACEISPLMMGELKRLQENIKTDITILPSSPDWQLDCQIAAHKAQGKIIAFLNASLSPLPDCRLDQLILLANRDDLAMVGGLVWQNDILVNGGYYPDVSGFPFPLLQGIEAPYLQFNCWGQFLLPRHVIGVGMDCMIVKKEALENGVFLDPHFGSLASVDFAMRMSRSGKYTLVSPWGQWSLASDQQYRESDRIFYERIREMWGDEIRDNPLRNPNLKKAQDNCWTLIL